MHLRTVRRQLRRDERGTSIVLVAVTMVVIVGFAGLAVDLANAWSQRRQDQSTVDTAGVAGAIFTAERTKAQAIADASAEVIRISKASLSLAVSDTEWATAWAACQDLDRPTIFTVISPASPCISFTATLQRLRVNLPEVAVTTAFGGVLGIDEIATSAAAEIEIFLDPGGGAMPFGMPGLAGGDGEICLKTGSNPNGIPPCDGPTIGNFAFLDITEFGNLILHTTQTCTGSSNTRLARNIAQGADHPIGVAPSATSVFKLDRDACLDGNFNAQPYTLTTETGNMASALHDGFVDGVSGVAGRLTNSTNTITIAGNAIDDTPLWDYLTANGKAICGSISDHDAMVDCLQNVWQPSDGVIFSGTIDDAARFGWVPLFWDLTLGTGTSNLNIQEFRPVFIQTTFWKCTSTGCKYIHDPGEPLTPFGGGGGSVKVEASTSIQIPFAALPDEIVENGPGKPGQLTYAIIE